MGQTKSGSEAPWKTTTRQFTSYGLVLLGPHSWARSGVGAPMQASAWQPCLRPQDPAGSRVRVQKGARALWLAWLSWAAALTTNYPQLGWGWSLWVPARTAAPATQLRIAGRTWMNTCMDWFSIHFYLFAAGHYELLSDTLKHLLSVTPYCISCSRPTEPCCNGYQQGLIGISFSWIISPHQCILWPFPQQDATFLCAFR